MLLSALFLPLAVSAKLVKDTVFTRQNDKIILEYDLSVKGSDVDFIVKRSRIIPGENLRKACKGDLKKLKVVVFDQIGAYGDVKWEGLSPDAFMLPPGIIYENSEDGYFILGETTVPISFIKKTAEKREISMPLYLAVYEKKQTYKIVCSSSSPLKITVGKANGTTSRNGRNRTETERIAIQSSEEQEADNADLTKALSSIQMIRQMLASETEIPFSQALQMEIYNLRSLKERVQDTDVIEKINEVLLQCSEKERELKEKQKKATLASQSQEHALMAQQKAEEEDRQKKAEEKERIREEKQQERTMWMIIGGAILAFLAFIGNAVFKHFRDVRNQKSIMDMQASLARQAENEAGRRSREIIRNKAHQVVKKGQDKMGASIKETGKTPKNSKIKSI